MVPIGLPGQSTDAACKAGAWFGARGMCLRDTMWLPDTHSAAPGPRTMAGAFQFMRTCAADVTFTSWRPGSERELPVAMKRLK